MSQVTPFYSLRGISKAFPGVKALDEVQLDLYPGEVMALIGENGAGKSTLVKTMTGIYQPDSGELRLAGEAIKLPTPDAATKLGITAIHQETVLFDELSVTENIFTGHHLTRGPLKMLDWRAMRSQCVKILAEIEAQIDPDILLKNFFFEYRSAAHGRYCQGTIL